LEGGVVDENVQPGELIDGSLDSGAAVCRVGDFSRNQHVFTRRLLDPVLRLPRILLLVQVRNENVRVLTSVCDSDRAADS
jgi:hypothetical protein